ncbi:MAG: L,D-transpeptidase family protein [Micropepsaceae bacterium]
MNRASLALFAALLCIATASAAPLSRPVTQVTIEKAKRQMTLWSGARAVKTYRVALGVNPVGHKQQEGDSRTPEGRYSIDGKNPNSSFFLSLHISYPNRSDVVAARRRGVSPGSAIMIHGMPEGLAVLNALGLYPDWTAGCIAVSNADIKEIFSSVKVGTPIVIKP